MQSAPVYGLLHDVAPPPVGLAHPRHQRIEMAQRQEIRHRPLKMAGRMPDHHHAQGARFADEGFRTDHVAKPQAGEQGFGERADIDHPALLIQRLERWRRWIEEGHFEFVVILDNQEVFPRRHLQQLLAAFERHGHAGRTMMARRGEHHVGLVRKRIEPHSGMIDRHVDHIAARQVQCHPQARITGVLHHRRAPLVEQHLGRQPQGVLPAHGDQDLFRLGLDAAPGQGVERDVFDQFRVVAFVAVGGHGRELPLAQRLQGTLPPVAVIEDPLVCLPVDEGVGVAAPVDRFFHQHLAGVALADGAVPVDRICDDALWRVEPGALRRCRGNVVSRTPLGDQVIVGNQFAVGQCHGDTADPQVGRQFPAGRQFRTRDEAPGQDALADHPLDFLLQCSLEFRVEKKRVYRNRHSIAQPVFASISTDLAKRKGRAGNCPAPASSRKSRLRVEPMRTPASGPDRHCR
jgi:hypothetical protein